MNYRTGSLQWIDTAGGDTAGGRVCKVLSTEDDEQEQELY